MLKHVTTCHNMSQHVEQIVQSARALVDANERHAYLDTACGADPALRARVEALLKSDATLVDIDDVAMAALATPLSEGPGSRIGQYRLLQLIGEGGFGSVFLAEQERPLIRKVALKIIKLGMDTRHVVALFEQERQALAIMDHPNIARVLDAGATETGRPYFVMDLVKGDPIADYCDRHNLSIEQRLELFSQVCNAVQHAHTKGIIHRDLKPSNILVTTQDGQPVAKVIDFGIAKAIASKLTERTLFTEHKQLIGTPEYMSPEQAEGSLDIDTRTDVYSLGVLLYELLTGSTPFSGKSLRSAGYAEIQRIIREVDPPKPSTRLSQSTETLAAVAANRQTEPGRLGSIVRGELDWIVMRALEKDRQRRYETASEFAVDIRRYLNGEAIVAAPPSRSYRLRKFVMRNKGLVLAGSSVATALAIGAVAFAWQASVANEARSRAVLAEIDAQNRAAELESVTEFQARMLAQVDPTAAGALLTKDVTAQFEAALARDGVLEAEKASQARVFEDAWSRVNATDTARNLIDRTILTPGAEAIDRQFASQPLVAAQLRNTLADLYRNLALYDAALPLQEEALQARRRLLGNEHVATIDSMNGLGNLLRSQGKLAEAEVVSREAMDTARRVLGNQHPLTLVTVHNVSFVLQAQGKADEAEILCREALAGERAVLGEEHSDTLASIGNLALILQAQGKLAEAEVLHRESLDKRRRVLGEAHPETLIAMTNLANLLMAQSKFTDAEPILRDATQKYRRVLGESHPDTLAAINNLSFTLQNQGRLAEAEPYLREAMEKYRRTLGDSHPSTMVAINNMGILLQDLNRMPEAERYLREALELRRRNLGDEHPHTLDSIGNVGRLLQAENRLAEAEPFLREALEKKRRIRGEEHPDTLVSINNLGALLQAQGRYEEAEAAFRDAMEKCRRVLGEDHANTLITTLNTGAAMQSQGKNADAVRMLSAVEPKARAAFTGAYARLLAKLLTSLGRARAGLGEFAAAEPILVEAQGLWVATRGASHKDTRDCDQALIDLYAAWDAAESGKGHDAQRATWKATMDAAAPTK